METNEPVSESVSPPPVAPRSAWRAILLNLIALPVGHFYLGEATRGIYVWLAVNTIIGLGLGLLLFKPDRSGLMMSLALGVGATLILLIDTIVVARRRKPFAPRPYNRALGYVGAILVAAVAGAVFQGLVKTQIQAFRMPSESMRPTLLVGDYFFVDKTRPDRVGRDELVVIRYPQDPSKTFVKRVAAVANDVIEIRDKQLFRNHQRVPEPYVLFTDASFRPERDAFPRQRIPRGTVFVLGDNRDNSNDSRYWGPTDARLVIGRPVIIYWSWDAEHSRVRWDRIGRTLR